MRTGETGKSITSWSNWKWIPAAVINISVRNKLHNTFQKEMKSLYCYSSSFHRTTDCTLGTTLIFKDAFASDRYLSYLTWFEVFHHMQIPTVRKAKSNMQYCVSDNESGSNTQESIRSHLQWNRRMQSNADEQQADFMGCINKADSDSSLFNVGEASVRIMSTVRSLTLNFCLWRLGKSLWKGLRRGYTTIFQGCNRWAWS